MTTPILVFGCDGQVGWHLQRALAPLGSVTALNRGQCDLAKSAAIREVIAAIKPAIIVNAAAYTAVDRAETERELVQSINATAPTIMAESAKALGALFVHYSTDYVFNGRKSTPYTEQDQTCPVSIYGCSKRDGEDAVFAVGGRALIFRTSWVFAERGKNFVKTVLRLAREERPLRIVDDQIGSPTPAALIADTTSLILAATRRGNEIGDTRLYHLAAANPISWCGFAREILKLSAATSTMIGRDKLPAPDAVTAISTADYPTPAKRPENSRLDCSKVERDFGLELPDWRPYLARMLETICLENIK